jgi:hypothetical protein
LLERIRFDFPLLGAGAPEENDALEGGLTTETKVRIPWSDRANHARILDRKTRKSVEIPWPPEQASETGDSSDQKPPVVDQKKQKAE